MPHEFMRYQCLHPQDAGATADGQRDTL